MTTKLIVWEFLVSFGHVTLIKESGFGAEMWLITKNLKPEKSSKENGSIVISKDDCGRLSWYHSFIISNLIHNLINSTELFMPPCMFC
jgi:hypothetical protein